MADKLKIKFDLSCANVQGGNASEQWWFPYGVTDNDLRDLAQLRANMMGALAGVRAVERTAYNIGPYGKPVKVGRLAALVNPGAVSWTSSIFTDPTDTPGTSANKGVGCPVVLNLVGGKVTFSSQAFPPYILTQDEAAAPDDPEYSAVAGPWNDAVNSYSLDLVALGAQRISKFLPVPFAIMGGESGTDTDQAAVYVRGNVVATFPPGTVVEIYGRRDGRRRDGRLKYKHDPLSGTHVVGNSRLSDDASYTIIPLSCTLGGYFDPCRTNGFIAVINWQFINLAQYQAFPEGKSRRSQRTRGPSFVSY